MELKQKAQPFWMHWKLHPKGFGLYQFYPHQRKGNAGTQTPCPEAWTGYGTLMEELPIEEIL